MFIKQYTLNQTKHSEYNVCCCYDILLCAQVQWVQHIQLSNNSLTAMLTGPALDLLYSLYFSSKSSLCLCQHLLHQATADCNDKMIAEITQCLLQHSSPSHFCSVITVLLTSLILTDIVLIFFFLPRHGITHLLASNASSTQKEKPNYEWESRSYILQGRDSQPS